MKNSIRTLIFMFLMASFCQAAEILVPADSPTIQAGVDAAQDGDTVIVADGVYTGQGNRNILVKKSITVKSLNGASNCVIDCAGTAEDSATGFILGGGHLNFDKYSPLTHPFHRVEIDGFTIQNGYYRNGGGIFIHGNFMTKVSNCRLVNNAACRLAQMDDLRSSLSSAFDGRGGGIRCDGTTRLVNCVIEGNQAEKGGGVYCGPDTTILHCTITGNQASQQGGGIFYTVGETTDPGNERAGLINSIVWNNWAPLGPQLGLSDYMLLDTARSNLPFYGDSRKYGDNPGVVPFPPGQQGSIEYTGVQTHLAIDGPGFFVLDNEVDTVFTRIGNFAIDSAGYLVDPDTGRTVRRMPDVGEVEGFQTPGDLRIFVPSDYAEPASATSVIEFSGNLQAICLPVSLSTNRLNSVQSSSLNQSIGNLQVHQGTDNLQQVLVTDINQSIDDLRIGPVPVDMDQSYSVCESVNRLYSVQSFSRHQSTFQLSQSLVTELDQFSGVISGEPGYIHIIGTDRYNELVDVKIQVASWTGVGDVLNEMSAAFEDSTATVNSSGQICLTDDVGGYSRTFIEHFEYVPSETGDDHLELSGGFGYDSVGGKQICSIAITIFDSLERERMFEGVFVQTDVPHTWDFVVMKTYDAGIPGFEATEIINHRIDNIRFNLDGSYAGVDDPESIWVELKPQDGSGEGQRIKMDFGRPGALNGLTQFVSRSSAHAMTQNGYEAGVISSLYFQQNGTLVFTFSNGTKKTGAQIATAVFANPYYLSLIENDCYRANSRSGLAQIGHPQGTIKGKYLERRPDFITLTGTPMIVDHSVVQEGLKTVSFEDALSLRGMSWNEVYQSNPCFARQGQWVDHPDGTVSWKRGDYRLLPHSKYIDASIIYSGLPEHDIAGNDRRVKFEEDSGGIIPSPPFKINPDSLRKSVCDLGAYESSSRPVEAAVRIYPNTIEDISTWRILRSRIDGSVESPFERKWAYVMIQIRRSELDDVAFDQKRVGLTMGSGCRPNWVFAFENRRQESVCIAAIFDYGEFVESVRGSLGRIGLPLNDVDVDQTLDFWIDGGADAFLKTNGSIHYKRPGSERFRPSSD